MKLLTKATSGFDRVMNAGGFLACVFVAFIMLCVTALVTLRYLLGVSISSWAVETTEYSLLYITFLGSAWVLSKEAHVKVDVILNLLKPNTQAVVNFITSILCVITCLVITWYGVKVTWSNFQSGYFIPSILQPPKWPILAVIPVGTFLLFIQFLRRTLSFLRRWRTPSDKETKVG